MVNSLLYSRLYRWYASNRRILPWRETEDPYSIWLSEIILQQTRVAQGMDYYLRFVSRWHSVTDLAAADESEVLREWQGLGYYSRARNLHKAAQMVVANGWAPFPRTFDDIRALPGIGDYTAGAIASFAYNLPYPAMDGNVYRVVARLLDIDEAFDTTAGKKLFHKEIERLLDRENPRLFNSAIMEFGALWCTPSPGDNCLACPLSDFCLAHAHGTAELLPVRKTRSKVRDRWLDYHVYVTTSPHPSPQGRETDSLIMTLIRRREDPHDIWYHLYEFPCEENSGIQNTEYRIQTDSVYTLSAKRSVLCQAKPVFACTHILSHQRLHARFFVHRVKDFPNLPGTFPVSWAALDEYALSRLTLRALESIAP